MSDDYPSLFRECCLSVDVIPMADLNSKGSEQMSLVQLFVPTEVAHDTVAELGELGNVQFKDVGVLLLVSTLKAHSSVESKCQSFPTLLRWRDPPHR